MISKNMITLCSVNVNDTHGREKRNRVVEWIKTQKCSIAFLHEPHVDENIELFLLIYKLKTLCFLW